jgi:hypothetical protein
MFLHTGEFLESQRRELTEQADAIQQLKQAGLLGPRLQDRILLKAGDAFISLGNRMKDLSNVPDDASAVGHKYLDVLR